MVMSVSGGDAGHWSGLGHNLFPRPPAHDPTDSKAISLDLLEAAGDAFQSQGYITLTHLADTSDDDLAKWYRHFDRAEWVEIAELCRALGAGADVAVSALCDVDGLLASLPADGERAGPEHVVEAVRASFLTEATQQYLMSIGHQMTNIGVRLALYGPKAQEFKALPNPWAKMGRVVAPGATDRAAWCMHGAAADLVKHGRAPRSGPMRFLAAANRLHKAKDFNAVDVNRGQGYHQLRLDFARVDAGSIKRARSTHRLTLLAAQEVGRSLSPAYHALVDSSPRPRRNAAALPLMTVIESGEVRKGMPTSFGPIVPRRRPARGA